jgi:hypothetical protein
MAALPGFVTEANALEVANLTQGAEATAARDAAIAAWAASTAPAEQLAAMSRSIHFGAVVKAIIYDTSKDSDGGAWRKRCADKSWYTEALGFTGTWGGQAASNAAGWAACGSVTGGAYQSTADGKFYAPTSASTQTEIFRGNVREFPAQVAVVAETARVVIYDLTQTGCPMWMVFTGQLAGWTTISYGSSLVTSVAARDGALLVGGSSGAYGVLSIVNFVADGGSRFFDRTEYTFNPRGIASRNVYSTASMVTGRLIVNQFVNDVAITVLDTAPIDPATGMPVPTVAVATAGGVSVIKDDGTVVNSSTTVGVLGVSMFGQQMAYGHFLGVATGWYSVSLVGLAAAFAGNYYSINTVPAENATAAPAATKNHVVGRGASGLTILKENPATPTKGMVAYITNAYNSGWLLGDIRGAYLADTTAGTITASGELVANGTFATDISSWTAANTGTGSSAWNASGYLNLTGVDVSNRGGRSQTLSGLVVGRSYALTINKVAGSANVEVAVGGGSVLDIYPIASGITVATFVATATSHVLLVSCYSTGTVSLDDISVKLADADRSVKNKGLVVNGSLTKTAVASGAALVAYSGWSVANYLEQPYNTDLNFGTGDFCIMGWVNPANLGGAQYLANRGGASKLYVYIAGDVGTVQVSVASTSTSIAGVVNVSAWNHVAVVRVAGVLLVYVNGVQKHSAALAGSVGTGDALQIGNSANPGTLFSLVRITATAPSADQIAHIYRTELPLFQTNAQCTIAGSSTAVTALAYDDVADVLHVGTSWGRSGFRDLLRVDSEATTTGALTSLSANEGVVITGGASSGKVYAPAMYLRDELRRKDIARKALGKTPVFFDFDAVTSQVAFVLPKGYTTKAVYSAGTLKRLGASKDYTVNTDGFAETVTFAVAPGSTVWVSVMAVRSN